MYFSIMYTACIVVATLFATGYAEPLVTAAAQLAPRRPAAGSDFVGYISENGGCTLHSGGRRGRSKTH